MLALAPLFLMFLWFVWFGELVRMARAARFIWEMEKRINRAVLAAEEQGSARDGNGPPPLLIALMTFAAYSIRANPILRRGMNDPG